MFIEESDRKNLRAYAHPSVHMSGYGEQNFGRSLKSMVRSVVSAPVKLVKVVAKPLIKVAAPVAKPFIKVGGAITKPVVKVTSSAVKTVINPLKNPIKSLKAVALAPVALALPLLAKAGLDLKAMKRQSSVDDSGQEIIQYTDEYGNVITERQYNELVAKYAAEEKRLTREQQKTTVSRGRGSQKIGGRHRGQSQSRSTPSATRGTRELADQYTNQIQQSRGPATRQSFDLERTAVGLSPEELAQYFMLDEFGDIQLEDQGGTMQGFGERRNGVSRVRTFEMAFFDRPFYDSNYARPLQMGPVTLNGFGAELDHVTGEPTSEPGFLDKALSLVAKTKETAQKARAVRNIFSNKKSEETPLAPMGALPQKSGIFGMPTSVVVVGGVVLAGGIAYLVLKKK